jgi:hypothetical protein
MSSVIIAPRRPRRRPSRRLPLVRSIDPNPNHNLPKLQTVSQITRTIRFTNTTGGSLTGQQFSLYGLIGAFGTMATAANTVYPIFDSVKVHKVTIWAGQQSTGNTNNVAIKWDSSYVNSNNREFINTTLSSASPAMLESKPPGGSITGFWSALGGGNQTIFLVSCPSNAVIDVHMSAIMSDDEVLVPITTASAVSAGSVYYLTPNFGFGHPFVPTGVLSTF